MHSSNLSCLEKTHNGFVGKQSKQMNLCKVALMKLCVIIL